MIAPSGSRDEDPTDDGAADREERPTRTARTRAAAAINELGLHLSTLEPDELDRLELPEQLRREIDVCQQLKARGRGRQNRLIGQLLRAEDHAAIRKRVEGLKNIHRDVVRRDKLADRWLARLVEEGDAGVEALIAAHPDADRQRLRALTRGARKDDADPRKSKRARRELLRAIRALDV